MTSPTSSPRHLSSSQLPVAQPVDQHAAKKTKRRSESGGAAAAEPSSNEHASSSVRSAPSSAIPGAEQVPAQDATGGIAHLSSIIARIMVAARFVVSGCVDVAGTLNDMVQMEKTINKLARRIKRFTSSITGVTQALAGVAGTLPAIADATLRVGNTFSQAFPVLRTIFT